MKEGLLRKGHNWLKKEPKDKTNCRIFTGIFIGISGVLFTILINPPFIELIERMTNLTEGVLIGISTITTLFLTAVCYVTSKILEIWLKKQITLSPRYRLVAAILSIPLTLCLHKFAVVPFVSYEGRDEIKA